MNVIKRLTPYLLLAAGLAAFLAPHPQAAPAAPLAAGTSCDALTGVKIANTTITSAVLNSSGSFTAPGAAPAGAGGRGARPIADLPPFCAVHGVIKPTPTSAIHFEAWLPANNWNGRLQVVGNGGLAGTIGYAGMAGALREGAAVAATDTGHTSAEPATWLQDKERVIDYSHRGLHLTTEDAKALVKAFYAQPQKYAYYSGCSKGGQQGLMEAQRYPADFDGILAGDAANFWTHQMASEVWNGVVTSSPDTNLPREKLQMIQDKVVAACDMFDGAADGLISNPAKCKFDPAVLKCNGADGPNCLTAAQVDAVKKAYSGPMNPLNGKNIYPGFYPGNEMGWASGTVINRTTTSGVSSNTFWSYAVFKKPDWQFRTLDFGADIERLDREFAGMMNATDANLEPFRRLGHKLLYYHGAADPLIPAQNGVDYFETVVASQKGLDKTQAFFRAFLVPGLYHCSGGPGPTAFGTAGEPPAAQNDADHHVGKALQRWVETGTAPAKVIATRYVDGDAAKGVAFQRPLCPYPQVSMYSGTGDMKDAANFSCVAPK
jgi:feruloyl esterase